MEGRPGRPTWLYFEFEVVVVVGSQLSCVLKNGREAGGKANKLLLSHDSQVRGRLGRFSSQRGIQLPARSIDWTGLLVIECLRQ